MSDGFNYKLFQDKGMSLLRINYIFGAKGKKGVQPSSLDCSGLITWLFGECGILVPNGSHAQYLASKPVSKEDAHITDVGFFKTGSKPCHHVGVLISSSHVLEARGEPYEHVILRPRDKWEAWKDFTGWRRFSILGA